jgi:drug/metabolite transporter (DMT)-like permease
MVGIAGVVPAVAAGIGFGLFQLVNRRALRGVDVYRGTATLLGVGAAVLLLIAWFSGGLALVPEAPIVSLLFCAAAGFVHFFCGWTLLGMSQVRVGAARTGILIGTVPLFGALIAAIFLDEGLTRPGIIGLVVVVTGVWVVSARQPAGSVSARDGRLGALAGLGAALCWSSSPVLIRIGLQGLPSPLAAAALGMLGSGLVYVAAVVLSGRRSSRTAVGGSTRWLLLVAGVMVSLSIWMQWTAYDLAPIAMVLALLQVTPITVVLLATKLGGDVLSHSARRRVWIGTLLTVSGSLVLVLAS